MHFTILNKLTSHEYRVKESYTWNQLKKEMKMRAQSNEIHLLNTTLLKEHVL